MRFQDDFPTLTHLVKLDLSKNQLEELPEYFGHLKNLKHLDLYSNKISKLPLSFSQLKNLQWLDLTKNPLAPALQQAAGPCITPSDCKLCAKKVSIHFAPQALEKKTRNFSYSEILHVLIKSSSNFVKKIVIFFVAFTLGASFWRFLGYKG